MKETIIGSLIIGGLISGAILLTKPEQRLAEPIHGYTDPVWISDDIDSKHDSVLIKEHEKGKKHIVIKKMGKPHGEHVFTEKSNGNFIIKMDSENPEDIDIDFDKILNEITEGVSDEHDDLNINISVKVDSDGAIESLDGLTDSIIKSVNKAIEGLSDNIDIQVSVKSPVSKSSDENKENVD